MAVSGSRPRLADPGPQLSDKLNITVQFYQLNKFFDLINRKPDIVHCSSVRASR